MNDANIWQTDDGLPRVSEDAFQANLREIVARGRNAGARSVVMHTNHPTTRDHTPLVGTSQTYQERNTAYNELIRAVASADARITLVDIEAAWRERTGDSREALQELLLPDELHLSEQGHRLYAEITGPVLERELRALVDGRP
jgi:lysophospholipase L1-like esterase